MNQICQNKINSDIFSSKESKINFDQGFFVWQEFYAASVNKSDSQIASEHLKNKAFELSFSSSGVVL